MTTNDRPLLAAEADARRVLLLQAHESGAAADDPRWSADDARWASRLARETLAEGATPQAYVVERSRHAAQRLGARDAALGRLVDQRGWRWWWLPSAMLLGLAAGVVADLFGGGQIVNLLAPPVWAVIAWNALVYLSLLLPQPRRLTSALARRLAGSGGRAGTPRRRFQALWLERSMPLLRARAALLLHAAAAALALGLMLGLYLRGLVLDYRAGWQSTFVDAEQLRLFLSAALAPAAAFTGIVIPDAAALQAMRIAPGTPAAAGAAPWIHLYAAQLVLLVVLPRTVLALVAALRAAWGSRHVRVPLAEPYFQRLLAEQAGRAALVQVIAHGAAPSPHVLGCLRTLLAQALYGDDLQIAPQAAAVAWGDEETAAGIALPPGTTLRLLLVDLGATPEDDAHGALVDAAARAGVPLLLLADEAAFASRFASLPQRLAERRAAWATWAGKRGTAFASADIAQPDIERARRELPAALR